MIRVLVVEDDFRVAQVNRSFVEQVPGFQVVGVASTAAKAEEMLGADRPDLMMLDLYLPDGSGLDLLKRLRAACDGVDVIVVTAAKEAATVQAALRSGAVDYLLKPYRKERFTEALTRYLESRGQMAALQEMEQEQVDRLLGRAGARQAGALPKGIDHLTLERVMAGLQAAAEPLTAEELGRRTGLSRTTARRYLEYLAETGRVKVDAAYGDVGRPERLYDLNQKD